MTDDLTHDPDDSIERYRVEDVDGDLFAVLTYFHPRETPSHRYNAWRVDFANGDRLTGDAANEVAKRLLNQPGTDGNQMTRFDSQADSILDSVVYDDDSRMFRITVRGTRVWFKSGDDQGDDVVLYQDRSQDQRAGVIEDPPFDAAELAGATQMARRQTARHR